MSNKALRLAKESAPGKGFGRFLQLVKANDETAIRKEFWKASLSETISGEQGGYLVPPEILLDLLEPLNEDTILWPHCVVVPMKSLELQLPVLDVITPTPAGVAGLLAGVQMSWVVETQSMPESAEPEFFQLTLTARQLSGVANVSNNLLKDQEALEKWLTLIFSEAIGWYSEYFFLQGTGVGQPMGVLNAPATVKVIRSTPGAFLQADAAAMLQKLYPSGVKRAIWLMSPTVFSSLTTTNSWGSWVFEPIKDDGSTASIFGHSAFVTEKLPALGTYGDVVLMDPMGYIIGDRQEVEIALNPYGSTVFQNNQTQFRVLWRGDGQPRFSAQFDLQDDATVVGPFAALQ